MGRPHLYFAYHLPDADSACFCLNTHTPAHKTLMFSPQIKPEVHLSLGPPCLQKNWTEGLSKVALGYTVRKWQELRFEPQAWGTLGPSEHRQPGAKMMLMQVLGAFSQPWN